MAKIIPFKKPMTPRQAVRKVIDRKYRKERAERREQVLSELVNECKQSGPPDLRLLDKIIAMLRHPPATKIDVFAVYLYRKKLNG